jgi:hypothetical protein
MTNYLQATTARALFFDLLKRSLVGRLTEDPAMPIQDAQGKITAPPVFDWYLRKLGRDWPSQALTMIGQRRLDNLQTCIEKALEAEVPGDLVETGVWRGGATILMRAVLKAYGVRNRTVWAADSFRGVPRPQPKNFPHDLPMSLHRLKYLSVPLKEVRVNFTRYGLLDRQVRFLKGRFGHTLPKAPIRQIAVLRLDGDLYESTTHSLVYLYKKLSIGGFLIVDDYALACCRQAVTDYRTTNRITDRIRDIDGIGVYWKKTRDVKPK